MHPCYEYNTAMGEKKKRFLFFVFFFVSCFVAPFYRRKGGEKACDGI